MKLNAEVILYIHPEVDPDLGQCAITLEGQRCQRIADGQFRMVGACRQHLHLLRTPSILKVPLYA